MSKLVIESDLRDALSALTEATELVDECGRLVGYFEPVCPFDEWPLDRITEEELERRLAEEPTGQTWADIRRELEEKGVSWRRSTDEVHGRVDTRRKK